MTSNVLLIVFLLLTSIAAIFLKKGNKSFLAVYVLSTVYFSLAGPLYWLLAKDAYFVGVDWSADFWRSPLLLANTSLVGILFYLTLNNLIFKYENNTRSMIFSRVDTSRSDFRAKIIGIVGVIGAIILFTYGVDGSGDPSGSSFTLIAYQFSDMLIPVLIYYFASRGLKNSTVFIFVIYALFASIIGFRYKMVLLFLPVVLVLYRNLALRGKFIVIFLGFLVVAVFSLLTLGRKKFEGIDFEAIVNADWHDLLYGLFAETNLIFGLTSIVSSSLDTGKHIGLAPIGDVFMNFAPRAIFPDKQVGSYLSDIVSAGFLSEEGIFSGTAYPYIGEYLMMGGWIGLFWGVLIYMLLVRFLEYLSNTRCIFGLTSESGNSMVAVFFGYYAFSRGYLPQIAMNIVFIVLPYFYICSGIIKKRDSHEK